MNKYQKAWSNVYSLSETSDYYKPERDKKDIDLIKELVDKATPKKPIKKTYEYESMNEEILIATYYVCGCEKFSEVHKIDRFCSKCGQALDWSEDGGE